MSKPRYAWWGYVKALIRDFPRLEKEHQENFQYNVSHIFTSQPRSKNVSNPVETVVIKYMSSHDGKAFRAVQNAVNYTKLKYDGEERIKLIKMVFWDKTHTLHGASLNLHISYRWAAQWHGEFIRLVAKYLGLLD